MMKNIFPVTILLFVTMGSAVTKNTFEKDTVATSIGDLEITFIRHATLMFVINGTVIHVDPWSDLADYTKLPDADLILITHHHTDHLDPVAVQEIRTESTVVVLSQLCTAKIKGGIVMKNGDEKTILDIPIIAVPAYNIVHKRDDGVPFHVKGEGNGYILTFGDTRVYIAGDTENTPEMKALKDIDIAFLPMNLPYTMTPDMVADAVKAFEPRILYPYHFGDTNTSELLELLEDEPGIEVRIRDMP
jgi:L-ascorbate metabolism protein UlaG (beta-lactamase superfamily)